MEIRRFLWCAIFSLVFSALPSRTENILSKNTEEIIKSIDGESTVSTNEKQTLPKSEDFPRPGIYENRTGCSRYCIQKKIATLDTKMDSIKRVNIIWKIVNDSRVTFSENSSWGISGSQEKDYRWEPSRITLENSSIFNNHEAKCELYLHLGCEAHSEATSNAHTILDEYLNHELKTLASMNNTEGYTEIQFNVEEATEELRIFAVGKLSQAILEIPIAPRGDSRKPRPTLSLSRTSDARGVRLDARNPPSGEWRMKLLGVENSNYSFSIVGASPRNITQNSNTETEESSKSKQFDLMKKIGDREVKTNLDETLSKPEHLGNFENNERNKTARAIKSDDEQILSAEHLQNIREMIELSALKEFVSKVEISRDEETKSAVKFPGQANGDVEMMDSEGKDKMIAEVDETAKILEDSELEELSRSVEDGQTTLRRTVVDVNPRTELIARPGTIHDVVFTVKNNQALGIRHVFQGESTHFRVIGVIPPTPLWIRPGEEIDVIVRIIVPNIQETTPNIVTLYVGGGENFEVVKKSTYIYIQGSSVTKADNDKPNIDYTFNDNCAGKLSRERCIKSRWSVEITAKDAESGLKRVTSLPEGIEPRTQFIAGTKNAVNFYYISSCCYTTVEVTATDVQGNTYTRTIDVTEWDNLSQGEIAAIVVGALLILIIIIIIILLCIYCVRKRKSHDLSYSQRYGSRTPASAERTNF